MLDEKRGCVADEYNLIKMQQSSESRHGPVRHRGTKATTSILQATLQLGAELGFDALTVEMIAAQTRTAKTTIYRRWPNVSAIIMDAFLVEVTREAPIVEQTTVRETFTVAMKLLVHVYNGRHGRTLRALIGRAQADEHLRHAMQTHWVEPRRKAARELLYEGMHRGELRAGLDPDVVLDALYGAIYHRFLIPYDKATLSTAFVNALVTIVFEGIEAEPESF